MVGFGPLVSADWLDTHLDDPDLVVVDCRWSLDGGPGAAAFESGHIPGAVFADLDTDLSSPPIPSGGRHPLPTPEAFAAAMARLGVGDTTRVVAYDDAGGVIAARLWWMLDVLQRPAAVLDGGLAAWTGDLATGTTPVAPGSFTAESWPPGRTIDHLELLASLDGRVTILDARSPDRYSSGGPVEIGRAHV